jgi:murein DD-endopeptidase MepM/ murein hydrolase activator NlpD
MIVICRKQKSLFITNSETAHYFYRMKTIVLFVLIITFQFVGAQSPIKLYFEKENGNTVIYADNSMHCPVSLKLKIEKTNMDCEVPCNDVVVVPPKGKKYKLATLVPQPNKAYKFSYNYEWYWGDITTSNYDKEHTYYLPFEKGKDYPMSQGYNGKLSHHNTNALDFSMPEGSNVTAARDGIVIQVIQNNWQSCAEERCKEYNNKISIYHSDGTFAQYAHIKQNGALVKEGVNSKEW